MNSEFYNVRASSMQKINYTSSTQEAFFLCGIKKSSWSSFKKSIFCGAVNEVAYFFLKKKLKIYLINFICNMNFV